MPYEAILPTVKGVNWLLDSFDLCRSRPPQALTPMFGTC